MAYVPAPALTSSAVTDSAGGVISRTIDATDPATHVQSVENKERSSLVDMHLALRLSFQQMSGVRGGGYRRIATIASMDIVPASGGTTINAAGVGYATANENAYRGSLGTAINALIADINAVGFTSGPRSAVTRITDNSGGTTSQEQTISNATTLYNPTNENGVRAQFAATLNSIANAIGA